MTLPTPTIEDHAADVGASGVAERRRSRAHLLVLALIAYVPLLFTHPGWIASDTKAYLYLDPTTLLRTARYLWNPNVGMGSVTHQNIGYLFPMGPWYWAFHAVGVPTWIAQRLWMGTLMLAAGTGVRYLARLLGLSAWAQLAAALPYMLTPFIIDYLARTSAILMPWAGLGWLCGFIVLAVRRGGWRYPALFALVVALIGGVNATSILLVGLAPALWLVLALVNREAHWTRVGAAALRAGGLSVAVSLWWAAGLWAEGAYGINVLRYTETFPTVTMTSLSSEVLRGLGYWYFYGNDKIQPWTLASPAYMSHTLGVLVSFAVPAIALASAAFVRWRYRSFAVLLIVVGVVAAVGAYPLSDPTPLGHVLRDVGENSTIGLAMRSSNRVIPIVVLGLSLLVGSLVHALRHWRPSVSTLAALLVGALACVNMSPLFEGKLVATNLMFPETLPSYVTQAASYLNAGGDSPVLGLPGADFGYYRWGVTMDAVWPGLLHRPYIQRQAVLQGEPASANLLRALDESIQDGVLDPATVVPMARLMGVGTILLQSDLQYERFDLPRPQALWLDLTPAPAGMRYVAGFGSRAPERTEVGPIIDETQLSIPVGSSYPPALAVFSVSHPRALLRTESTQDPLLLDGDGEGVLLAAGDGLLNGPERPIVYAASRSPSSLAALAGASDAELVVTDTNAKELDTWGTLHTTYGYVEQPGAQPAAYNPAEQSLPIFASQAPDTETVLLVHGLRAVTASGYGNPVANAPEAQPLNAVDSNPDTAWTVAAFSDPRGQFLRLSLLHPVTVSRLFLRQPQVGVQTRWITRVKVSFSHGTPVVLHLGPSSRTGGQSFSFAPHATSSLTLTITDMTGSHTDFSGSSGVGFSEVKVPGVGPVTSSLELPSDLLAAAGPAAAHDPLVILVHRLRAATVPPRTDPELSMSRTFALPAPRRFTVTGTARVSTLLDDRALDAAVGRGGGAGLHVVTTNSSTRLTGSLTNGSWEAFDGDADTSWSPAFLAATPQWLSATLSAPTTLSTVGFRVVVDGRHSLPESVRITSNTGASVLEPLAYPKRVPGGSAQGRSVVATIRFAPLSGTTFRFAFPKVRSVTTTDHVSGLPIALPIGIAEVALPGVAKATTPARVPAGCRTGLLTIDGVDVPVRLTGTTSDALAQRAVTVTSCRTVALAAGTSLLATAPGSVAGFNLDTLALSSPGTAAPAPVAPTATLTGTHWTNPVSLSATVGAQTGGSWLVLDQSFSSGWRASVGGHDLGAPVLLDGGYTAWRLGPTTAGEAVRISWTPQSTVDEALLASLVALLALIPCIVYGKRERRRRRRRGDPAREPVLAWPWQQRGRPRLVLAACGTVAAMALAGPAVAIVAVPLVLVAWAWPRARTLLALGPGALLGLAGVYVVYEQDKYGWPHDIQWPTHFGLANTLGWVAVSLLLVDLAAYGAGGTPWALASAAPDGPGAPTPSTGSGPVTGTGTGARPGTPPLVVPHAAAPGAPPAGAAPSPTGAPPTPGFLARILPLSPLAVLVRRRLGAPEQGLGDPTVISLPGGGLARSVALFGAFRKEQTDPDRFYRTIALDTLHRLTGAAPLFNRTVVDVGGGAGYFAEAFRDAGARVVLVEPEAAAPLPRRLAVPEDRLDRAERHERAVWPGRLVPDHTIAGDGMALPLPTNCADLVFSSNVLEHVADPKRFLDEAVRVTRPGGLVYVSFTLWWSPWGGHETSPWHLLGGRFALRRYTRRHGHPPKNVYGQSLFALNAGTVLRMVSARDDVEVVAAEPRYYPRWASFVVRVPVVRELVSWNLVLLLEKL